MAWTLRISETANLTGLWRYRVGDYLVICEIQELWFADPEAVWTRPYKEDHVSRHIHEMGASLHAFVHLAHKKDMRLVGCHKQGYNALFVRNGEGEDLLGVDEYDPANCFTHATGPWKTTLQNRRRSAVHLTWVDPRKVGVDGKQLDPNSNDPCDGWLNPPPKCAQESEESVGLWD